MRLQKYSDMGGIDLVCRQMYPGQRPHDIYQTPKLGSSITHVYGKDDDVTMCEMFGAYGQDITYPPMKWLTDQMQVRGVNFMIPHSFNPKSPNDRDCPPYFWNSGFEPRWPLFRVYADWTSRLSLMLSGGRHVCPIALLFSGNLRRVGKTAGPEDMTTALQDALFDCDWLPMEVFAGAGCSLDGKQVKLHQEWYGILIVPPTEVIPYEALAKAKEFLDKGGVVVGYGLLPTKSATIGKTDADIAACRTAIWGDAPTPGVKVLKTTPAGGRSYFLPEKPTPEQLQEALTGDAGVHPTIEVLKGQTDGWLHVLHRVKAGRDVFLVCNQDVKGQAKDFRLRATAEGVPECWDAMRNELTALPHRRTGPSVEFDITLEPMESVLVVFQPESRPLPVRLAPDAKPIREPIPLVRVSVPAEKPAAPATEQAAPGGKLTRSPIAAADPFVGQCELPADLDLAKSRVMLVMDSLAPEEAARVTVNGAYAGGIIGKPFRLDVTPLLKAGANTIRIEPFAPKTAHLAVFAR